MKDLNNRLLSSLVWILTCFALAFWILFYMDNSLYEAIYIKKTGLVTIVLSIGLFMTTKQLVVKARAEQQIEDIKQSNKIHEIEKRQLIEELKKYEGLEHLINDLEEKLESSQLYEIPLISNLLLQKKILLHQQGVQLEIETDGNLETLNKIDIADFNSIVGNSIKRLKETQSNFIGLRLYERDNHIELSIFSSVSNMPTSIKELSWQLQKVTKKYKANVDITYEPVNEDNFIPLITINFPKQIKARKIS